MQSDIAVVSTASVLLEKGAIVIATSDKETLD